MWQGIAVVSSGITLVAFLIAAGVYAYRSKLQAQVRLIQSAPDAERGRIVEQTLEFFAVDTAGLSKLQRYTLAVQQIASRERRYYISAVLVLALAFLAGAIVVLALIMEGKRSKLSETPKVTELVVPPEPRKLAPTLINGGALTDAELKRDARVSNADNSGQWVLVVHLTAKFSSEQYNRAAYHLGISELQFELDERDSKELLSDADYRQEEPAVSGDLAASESGLARPPTDRLEQSKWVLYLYFQRLPVEGDTFTFYTGPRKWTLPVGTPQWTKIEGKDSEGENKHWSAAQATLALSLEDPDWVVASEARLVGSSNSPAGTLIEVVLENHSKNRESLASAVLQATRITHATGSGFIGPQWQEVSLDWGAMTPLRDGSSAIEAATEISKYKVEVSARFRPGNQQGYNDQLVVSIPCQIDLVPNEANRFMLAVTEKLPLPMGRRMPSMRVGGFNLGSPYGLSTPLAKWDKVQLTFEPSGKVFPSVLPLKKPVAILPKLSDERTSSQVR